MHHLIIVIMAFFVNGADPTDTHMVMVEATSLHECADTLNSHHVINTEDGDTYYMTQAACRVAEVDKKGNLVSMSPLPEGN